MLLPDLDRLTGDRVSIVVRKFALLQGDLAEGGRFVWLTQRGPLGGRIEDALIQLAREGRKPAKALDLPEAFFTDILIFVNSFAPQIEPLASRIAGSNHGDFSPAASGGLPCRIQIDDPLQLDMIVEFTS